MLGDLIKAARVRRGWSCTELAARVRTSSQRIQRLERGVGTIDLLSEVLDGLDVRLSGLPSVGGVASQVLAGRRRRGLSISDVARAAEISRTTVREIEKGRGTIRSLDRLLAVLAPGARLKDPPRPSWAHAASRRGDDQFTPPDFIRRIESVFGRIDLDPAWHPTCAVQATTTYSLAQDKDGLVEPWPARLVWLNPPFSQMLRWVRKADTEWTAGRAKTVVALVPGRTDSVYFHDRLIAIAHVYLLRQRLRFIQVSGDVGNQAPFPLMLVVLGSTGEQRTSLEREFAGLWVGQLVALSQRKELLDADG